MIPVDELDDLRGRRQPARHVDARHHARRRDDRRLARPRTRPRRSAWRLACGSRQSTPASSCELSDGEMQEGATWEAAMAARAFPARRSRRTDRLQRHPGRRRDRARHGAGRRQVARVRLGHAARSTATIMAADRRGARRGARGRNGKPQGDRAAHLAGQAACRRSNGARSAHFVRVEPDEWDALRTNSSRHAEATHG